MISPLRILSLEDNAVDAELLRDTLEVEGIACSLTRVETEQGFAAALQQGEFDLILADYTLPSFDGLSALRIARQRRPDLPFIFVSGTMGEEVAVESLKIGASDYVLKSRLSRLVPSVQRALHEPTEKARIRRMITPLRILYLEDDVADMELVQNTLEREGIACSLTRVETEPDFVAAMQQGGFDLILADYTLPSFDGLSALKITRQQRPDLPFIFVSGTLGEEVAIESLKIGASDYVLKSRLSRLVPSVQRALREATEKAELRRFEEALFRSETELRQVIETIPAMVWSALPDGSNVLMNSRWTGYTGLAGASLGWQAAVHPDDLKRHLDAFRACLFAGMPFEDEVRLCRSDGEYRWFFVQGMPLRDEQGNVLKCYGIVTDIEDRKRTEETLRQQAELLSLTHDAISVSDMDFRITYWNRGAEELYGWTAEEACGKLSSDLLETVFASPLERIREELLRQGRWQGEFVRTTKDGARVVVASRWSLRRDAKGTPLAVLETNNDIGERKRTEEALQRQANLLEQAHDAIFAWKLSEKIVYWNRGAEQLYGFTREEAIGRSSHELLRTEHPMPKEMFEQLIEREGTWSGELTHTTRDGRKIVVESRHVVTRAADGQRLVLEANRDITERKYAEKEREKLRQLELDLVHMNRVSMLGELGASLSHELRQPITAAILNANTCMRWLALDQPNAQQARDAAKRAVQDVNRAGEVIDRLRSLYKKSAAVERELVDVNDVVREMLVLLRNEANRHSISIGMEVAAELPRVKADRVQLQQVLMNLMLNGIEAMKDTGGELMIKSQLQPDDQLLILVADTGIGLPAEHSDQIFNAFYTTKPEGSGMGLAISRSIVESHGGRLWATTNSGRGAIFHFTVPTVFREAKLSSTEG
jgi:PAS domain S-box-containing protein